MKRIIDIPDNEYRHIKEYYEKNDIVESTYSYIYHGTPLPKGHGRLIDADDIALIDEQFYTSSDYYVAESAINDAPTIIEADAESEDKT